MFAISKIKVLAVGLGDKSVMLQKLPVRIKNLRCAAEAARSLKTENFDSIMSKWDLSDMKNGRFIKNLRLIKPKVPIIAITESENFEQEIAARSIGVSAVIPEQSDDRIFIDTVSQTLGL